MKPREKIDYLIKLFKEKTSEVPNVVIAIVIVLFYVAIPMITIPITVYILMWIAFPENLRGKTRGIVAFIFHTVLNLGLILMSYVLLAFNDSGSEITFLILMLIFIFPTIILILPYAIGHKLHKINYQDGSAIYYWGCFIIINVVLKAMIWYLLLMG